VQTIGADHEVKPMFARAIESNAHAVRVFLKRNNLVVENEFRGVLSNFLQDFPETAGVLSLPNRPLWRSPGRSDFQAARDHKFVKHGRRPVDVSLYEACSHSPVDARAAWVYITTGAGGGQREERGWIRATGNT
jgi:hypothetical protein